ncbi:type IV secretion system protein VirB3 [Rhizobiales bacterium GAS113]|nr:type IV secretion system protein VirB3 [Rhizobiales bacterium GAS113]
MNEDVPVALDPIVRGLTRPAMMWGVPYVIFVLEMLAVVMVFINTKRLLVFLVWPVLHAVAYWMTVKDPFFIDIVITRNRFCSRTANRAIWGGDSYSP